MHISLSLLTHPSSLSLSLTYSTPGLPIWIRVEHLRCSHTTTKRNSNVHTLSLLFHSCHNHTQKLSGSQSLTPHPPSAIQTDTQRCTISTRTSLFLSLKHTLTLSINFLLCISSPASFSLSTAFYSLGSPWKLQKKEMHFKDRDQLCQKSPESRFPKMLFFDKKVGANGFEKCILTLHSAVIGTNAIFLKLSFQLEFIISL